MSVRESPDRVPANAQLLPDAQPREAFVAHRAELANAVQRIGRCENSQRHDLSVAAGDDPSAMIYLAWCPARSVAAVSGGRKQPAQYRNTRPRALEFCVAPPASPAKPFNSAAASGSRQRSAYQKHLRPKMMGRHFDRLMENTGLSRCGMMSEAELRRAA